MAEIADHIEVNELARKTGMSSRYWKDHAKEGRLRGYKLGNKIVMDLKTVNDFLAANQLKRIEQPIHLRVTRRSQVALSR